MLDCASPGQIPPKCNRYFPIGKRKRRRASPSRRQLTRLEHVQGKCRDPQDLTAVLKTLRSQPQSQMQELSSLHKLAENWLWQVE